MRRTIPWILCSLVLAMPISALALNEVSLSDLTLLAKSGLSDQTTLVFLDTREIEFVVDPETITSLREQGVSEEIIRYLLERTNSRTRANDRIVYVSTGQHPSWYYGSYYGHDVFPNFGYPILSHWTHGYHWSGGQLGGAHHLESTRAHSSTHGIGRHASRRHRLDGHAGRGHASGGRGLRSHSGSRGARHAGLGHSGGRHRGRSHGGGRHGGGGGHGGGGHGGGH